LLAALIYLLLFLFLIYRNGFFGLFKDEQVSNRRFTVLFFAKALAIPVFVLVYDKFYGGLERFDAGIFYSDAKAVNALAYLNPLEYVRLLFGLQDDSEGSYVYEHCLINTVDWDNGKVIDFFYNDNRVLIRLHSLLHFIAFDSYLVHALFNCFLSFVGVLFLYRAFKEFFIGKEGLLLLIFCFFPTLWFYTGAVSKEGLALFVLGCSIFSLKKIIYRQAGLRTLLWLIFLLFISCLLKPYLLCFSALCFTVFFVIHRFQARFKVLLFTAAVCIVIFSANILSILVKQRSLTDVAFERQHIFAAAARGGIFLLDSVKFVRLEYDSTLVKRSGAGYYTIKAQVPYIYWEHSHQQDTLFCEANTDTSTRYQLVYQMEKSGSNISSGVYSGSLVRLAASCLYYSLFYPFFINARGALQLAASFENLVLAFSLIILLLGFIRNKKDYFLPLIFLFFALALCTLVGLTTPNSGAIFRYRSPAVIFMLAAALYYTRLFKSRAPD
jgi:hypothetical protein